MMRDRMFACLVRVLCVTGFGLFAHGGALRADEPLAVRIDRLVAAKAGDVVAERTTDEEFVRRVHLDFVGRIPTAEETRSFVADGAADKRRSLVDRLLASPEHPRRMAELFNVALMERLDDHPEWLAFLEASFAANKPWDVLVREILDPNADDEAVRGAAQFIKQRIDKVGQQDTDHPGLTRDVGRLFLGLDLQCAQCHDHPHVDDYKQRDFQGLFVVYGGTSIRTDVKFPAVAEKPLVKRTEFVSVFTQEKGETGPRLPFAAEDVVIPVFKKGEEFLVPPDKTTKNPGVLKFRGLHEMAVRLASKDNRWFARNGANRLWFLLMGRGLVHPLDLDHSKNPPSHPELLDLLTAEFARNFDVRAMLRELAATETYQRSSRVPSAGAEIPPERFAIAIERPISAEQYLWSMLQATGERERYFDAAGKPLPAPAAKPAEAKDPATKAGAATGALLSWADVRKAFVKAYANAPRDPEEQFLPSLRSVLFVSNGEPFRTWLDREGNLVDRLNAIGEPDRLADELFVTILSRRPVAEEVELVRTRLQVPEGERRAAVRQLAWALFASTEFQTNH